MGGPSDKAAKAASDEVPNGPWEQTIADSALNAAHDPALGPDRSVCLRDVAMIIAMEGDFNRWEKLAHLDRRDGKQRAWDAVVEFLEEGLEV